MTNDSDSFIKEVDEGLRQDRVISEIRRYGPYALAGLIVLLLAMGGWQVWRAEQTKAAQRQSDQFAAALQQASNGDLDSAKTAFEQLSTHGPSAYRLMARMEHAAVVEQQGDLEAALREYDAIASDATDPIMKGSAEMRAAYIAADTQDFQAMQARLQPIIDRGGHVSFLAQELLAVEAWEAGQNDVARDLLQNIQLAFDAPESVRQRAQLALSVVGPAPDAAPADGAAAPANPPSQGETQ